MVDIKAMAEDLFLGLCMQQDSSGWSDMLIDIRIGLGGLLHELETWLEELKEAEVEVDKW